MKITESGVLLPKNKQNSVAYTQIDTLFYDYAFIINERLNSTLQITCLPSIIFFNYINQHIQSTIQ